VIKDKIKVTNADRATYASVQTRQMRWPCWKMCVSFV